MDGAVGGNEVDHRLGVGCDVAGDLLVLDAVEIGLDGREINKEEKQLSYHHDKSMLVSRNRSFLRN